MLNQLALIKNNLVLKTTQAKRPFQFNGIYAVSASAGKFGDAELKPIQQADKAPEGYYNDPNSRTVELIDGEPKFVYTVLKYPDKTPEEIRAAMPQLVATEFRRKLRNIKVVPRTDTEGEEYLDGIYEEDILEVISQIADRALAAEARDYFLYAQYFERTNPWVDILGSMFGITPTEIDELWLNA